MPGASLEAITGRLGIGAVVFLAAFLVVDGLQIGVFSFVEAYGRSTTWGLLGVLPTAVVTYLVGVFCVAAAEIVFSRSDELAGPEPSDAVRVSSARSSLVEQLYAEQTRTLELLKGSTIAFVLLALGCLAELPNMRGYYPLVAAGTLGSLGLSLLSFLSARRASERARRIAASVAPMPDTAFRRTGE